MRSTSTRNVGGLRPENTSFELCSGYFHLGSGQRPRLTGCGTGWGKWVRECSLDSVMLMVEIPHSWML